MMSPLDEVTEGGADENESKHDDIELGENEVDLISEEESEKEGAKVGSTAKSKKEEEEVLDGITELEDTENDFDDASKTRRYEFASDDGSLEPMPSLEEECSTFLKGHEPVTVKAGIYPGTTNTNILDRSSSREDSTSEDEEGAAFSSSSKDNTGTDEDSPRDQGSQEEIKRRFLKMKRRDSGPGSRNKWNMNQDEFFSEEERDFFKLPPVDEKILFEKKQKRSVEADLRKMKRRGSMGAVETGAAEAFGELSDDAADEFLDTNTDSNYLEETERNLFLSVKQQRERDEAARRLCDSLEVEENIPRAKSSRRKSRRSLRHQSVFEQRRSGKPRVPRPRPRSSKNDDPNVSGRSLVTIPDMQADNTARIGTFRLSNPARLSLRSTDDMLKKSPFCGRKKILVFSCLFFGIGVMVGSVILFPDLIHFDSAFLANSDFFRGSAAMRNEQILLAKLGPHPDYTGAIAPPEGEVTLVFDRFSQITASLHLPNIISKECHWEILTGNTCGDSKLLGTTPFYNTSLWQHGSPYEGQTQISSIHIGYSASETAGHAIVVYAPGPYYQVACGILQKQSFGMVKKYF